MRNKCYRYNRYLVDYTKTHRGNWRLYASINKTSIGSDNGLAPNRRQTIIWTVAGLSLIRPLETYFNNIWKYRQHEDVIENNIGKIAIIFSRPQCVKRGFSASTTIIDNFIVLVSFALKTKRKSAKQLGDFFQLNRHFPSLDPHRATGVLPVVSFTKYCSWRN